MKKLHNRAFSQPCHPIQLGNRMSSRLSDFSVPRTAFSIPAKGWKQGNYMYWAMPEVGLVRTALALAELRRILGDCSNCVSKRLCSVCPAMILAQGDSERADAVAFQRNCQGALHTLRVQLERYTAVMEMKADCADEFLLESQRDNPIDDVRFVPTEEQLHTISLGVEELGSIV